MDEEAVLREIDEAAGEARLAVMLLGVLIDVLMRRGVLNQDGVAQLFDATLFALETVQPEMTRPAAGEHARRALEILLGDVMGPPPG